MKTLVLTGSIRSQQKRLERLYRIAEDVDTIPEYTAHVGELLKNDDRICNSDILTGTVMMAMNNMGADVEFMSLTSLFPKRENGALITDGNIIDNELALTDTLTINRDRLTEFMDSINAADGVVLVTPVYFGDRSSVANKLLQISGIHDLLRGKVFGACAVGAKRNGGQETTVIYCLMEALSQNAIAVGNGPPTSQYGGTAVGGHRGTVNKDLWGLETTYGTGVRVSHVSNIMTQIKPKLMHRPVRILVLVTMDDSQGILQDFLKSYLSRAEAFLHNIEFKIHNVLERTIYRCLGCDSCPAEGRHPKGEIPTPENHGKCVINNDQDALEEIHNEFLEADAVILAGLNVKRHHHLIYRYQAMMERTRCIRRNNFELTDKMMTALTLNQVGARVNSLHSIKMVTSYIRHNSILGKPIEVFMHDDKVIDDGMDDLLSFARTAEAVTRGKQMVEPMEVEYTTAGIGGY